MSHPRPSVMAAITSWRPTKHVWTWTTVSVVTLFVLGPLVWFHITNPYAGWTIVRQPYTASVDRGQITLQKQFAVHAYSGRLASWLGYYKSGFLIAQNTAFGGHPLPASTFDDIARDLHKERFDPTKPYLISGDQFSVLYPRNLGIFYSSLLDPYTADSQQDWQNRQRLYLQSVMYALDAFSSKKTLTTTIVPIGPKSALLTEVHPGSVPSDTLYGMLYALNALEDQSQYPNAPYKLQAISAVKSMIVQRRSDFQELLQIYLSQVRDSRTGLVKRSANISGARDGVLRDSSFYDNVILWKTLQLADKLGIQSVSADQLNTLRSTIVQTYWDNNEGHFKDDQSSKPAAQNYSSDWLIAVTTGFLDANKAADRAYLQRSIDFIHAHGIADPFPIKYQARATTERIPWAVRAFLPSYGANVVWSYWGCQYIAMLNDMYAANHQQSYLDEAQKGIDIYVSKVVKARGFPETFSPNGHVLHSGIYKSILRNGWIVDLEAVKAQSERLR